MFTKRQKARTLIGKASGYLEDEQRGRALLDCLRDADVQTAKQERDNVVGEAAAHDVKAAHELVVVLDRSWFCLRRDTGQCVQCGEQIVKVWEEHLSNQTKESEERWLAARRPFQYGRAGGAHAPGIRLGWRRQGAGIDPW